MTKIAAALATLLLVGCGAPLASPSPEPSPSAAALPSPTPSPSPTPPAPAQTPTNMPAVTASPLASATPQPSATPVSTTLGDPVRISERRFDHLALAVTPDGVAHAVAAMRGESDGLYYLTNGGGEWTEELLTSSPARGADVGPSVDIDSDGAIHVVFTRWTRYTWCWLECPANPRFEFDGLYHLANRDGAWSEPERLLDRIAGGATLRVHQGNLHLAYATEAGAHYATNAGGSWATTELAADGEIVGLEVDDDGTAFIVFNEFSQDRTVSRLFLASVAAGAAPLRRPLAGLPLPDPVYVLLFAVDGQGQQHFAFYGDDDGSQYVMGSASEQWTEPMSIFEPALIDYGDGDVDEVPRFPGSIAVDAGGWVHAVNQDVGQGGAYVYATNRGGAFTTQELLPLTEWDDAPSPPVAISLDGAGRPHVLLAMLGEEDAGLWYARTATQAGPAPEW